MTKIAGAEKIENMAEEWLKFIINHQKFIVQEHYS